MRQHNTTLRLSLVFGEVEVSLFPHSFVVILIPSLRILAHPFERSRMSGEPSGEEKLFHPVTAMALLGSATTPSSGSWNEPLMDTGAIPAVTACRACRVRKRYE